MKNKPKTALSGTIRRSGVVSKAFKTSRIGRTEIKSKSRRTIGLSFSKNSYKFQSYKIVFTRQRTKENKIKILKTR